LVLVAKRLEQAPDQCLAVAGGQDRDADLERRAIARTAAAVLAARSEKAAANILGLSHATAKPHLASARSKLAATTTASLVWIIGPRLPGPTPGDDRSP
jgi:hypothetical protein